MIQEYPISRMIKIVNAIFETDANRELMELNITHAQLEVLLYIENQMEKDIEVNQIDIEKAFNLKNPTVTGILNRLEEKDYTKRVNSQKNARFKKIILTQTADDILKRGKRHSKMIEERLISCLSEEEQEVLKQMLDKMIKGYY